MDRAQIHLTQENPHEQKFPEHRSALDFEDEAIQQPRFE
jgi:hypothetical protein